MSWEYKTSVVMPVYNGEDLVGDAIESVLSQTLDAVELVVLNDGSTDDSKAVIEQYLPRPNVTYVEQENKGVTKTVNRGIRLANGEYLTVHPQDDTSVPSRLETQVTILEEYPDVGFVYSPASFVDLEGNELNEWGQWRGEGRVPSDELFYELYVGGMFIASPSVLFRRDHLSDTRHPWGKPDLEIVSDWEQWMAAAQHYDAAYELGEPMVEMLRDEEHDNLASRTGQVLQEEKTILKRVRREFASGSPPVTRRHFWKAMSNYYVRELRYRLREERDYAGAVRTAAKSFMYNPFNKTLYYEYAKTIHPRK